MIARIHIHRLFLQRNLYFVSLRSKLIQDSPLEFLIVFDAILRIRKRLNFIGLLFEVCLVLLVLLAKILNNIQSLALNLKWVVDF